MNELEDAVEFSVKDEGPGIPKEDFSKLFKKFQQLSNPAFSKGGTGLGLAICKEIIQQHGGKIEADTELGKGSCFYFTLPVKERRKR